MGGRERESKISLKLTAVQKVVGGEIFIFADWVDFKVLQYVHVRVNRRISVSQRTYSTYYKGMRVRLIGRGRQMPVIDSMLRYKRYVALGTLTYRE